jgi:hypothetical protein
MTDIPFWYKIITSLKSKNEITNGLTIPYLIGANALSDKSYVINSESIKELLSEIINSSIDEVAVLQKCDDIGQYVIGLRDKKFAEMNFKTETSYSNSKQDKTLYISLNASNLGSSIEEISERLNELFSSALTDGNYSWDGFNKKWKQFNSRETDLIKNSLLSLD